MANRNQIPGAVHTCTRRAALHLFCCIQVGKQIITIGRALCCITKRLFVSLFQSSPTNVTETCCITYAITISLVQLIGFEFPDTASRTKLWGKDFSIEPLFCLFPGRI